MADNDLLLRPKVDEAALRRSGRKMEREYQNAGIKAARKVAKFTQSSLTKAMKLASQAGASAMHSAFQVGLSGVMEQVGNLIQDIDGTVERTKDRAESLAATVNRAQAFNMSGAELFTIEAAGRTAQLDESAIQGILETFRDTLATSETAVGRDLANYQSIYGTFAAINRYMREYVSGQDDVTQQRLLSEAGFTGSAQTELVRLLSVAGSGVGSIESLSQRYLGLNQAQISDLISQSGMANNRFMEMQNEQVRNELFQASRAQDNVGVIQQLEREQMSIRNQQEAALKESAKFRIQVLELQQQMNEITIATMQHFEKVLQSYEKEGLSGAIGTALEPVTKAISEGLSGLKKDISDAIYEALPPILRVERSESKTENNSKPSNVPKSLERFNNSITGR